MSNGRLIVEYRHGGSSIKVERNVKTSGFQWKDPTTSEIAAALREASDAVVAAASIGIIREEEGNGEDQ